jgi:hypothetical protein
MKNYDEIAINELKPYENNARLHSEEQIEKIINSINEFGFIAPVIIDENNMILVGHGRTEAAKRAGIEKVPYRRITHLTDEQKRAYILADNKLSDMGDWNMELLNRELERITLDMQKFGFQELEEIEIEDEEETEEKYTKKIKIPQYEIQGGEPDISELFDDTKTQILIEEIRQSNVSEKQKDFLIKAAQRHTVFNYKNIAEYYAHQNKEMQELMEKSALVIIDFADAIANGYVKLSKFIDEVYEGNQDDEI